MSKNITHPELVTALVKPGSEIASNISAEEANIWHAASGIVGECGELLEAILLSPGKPINDTFASVIEELGDVEFYMEQLRQATGIQRIQPALNKDDHNLTARSAWMVVCGCAIMDTIKKHVIYKKPLDVELLKDQMCALDNSLLFICYYMGIKREITLEANIKKLSKRYASLSYSNEAAQARADKEVTVLEKMSQPSDGKE